MPRPKGSKNKKSIQTVAQVNEQIAAQLQIKTDLEARQAKILAAIDEQKNLLKELKRDLRTVEKALLSLEEKKRLLMEILDKNLLYVNYCDMDDEEFGISDADKAFTRSFYGEG